MLLSPLLCPGMGTHNRGQGEGASPGSRLLWGARPPAEPPDQGRAGRVQGKQQVLLLAPPLSLQPVAQDSRNPAAPAGSHVHSHIPGCRCTARSSTAPEGAPEQLWGPLGAGSPSPPR